MAQESDADIFKSQNFSDADLCIKYVPLRHATNCSAHKRQKTAGSEVLLTKFPVHLIILRNCEYFKAQALRWQDSVSHTSNSSKTDDGGRVQLVLTLDSPDHEAAAVAVIAALYRLKDPFASLQQHELVQVVTYADLLQLPTVVQQAALQLQNAAESPNSLSDATMLALAAQPAWPTALLPLLIDIANHDQQSPYLESLLFSAFGDLEALWCNEELGKAFMELDLPAVQLLLGMDQLQVACEDTVLYTATMYVKAAARPYSAVSKLAPLIRCPQLSAFQLAAQVAILPTAQPDPHWVYWWCQESSSDAEDDYKQCVNVLQPYAKFLGQLQCLLRFQPEHPHQLVAKQMPPGVPSSWLLGPRQIKAPAAGGVEAVWCVSVDELRAACRMAVESFDSESLYGPYTPPLLGMTWRARIQCKWDDDAKGTWIHLYADPMDMPCDIFYKVNVKICVSGGSQQFEQQMMSPLLGTSEAWGWQDYFDLGALDDGWDEAAWLAKGLPASGELQVVLSISDLK